MCKKESEGFRVKVWQKTEPDEREPEQLLLHQTQRYVLHVKVVNKVIDLHTKRNIRYLENCIKAVDVNELLLMSHPERSSVSGTSLGGENHNGWSGL